MGLKKLADKVADYKDRLKRGKASKIKPDHVKKVLEKLRKKVGDLESDITSTKNVDKKARLKRKLGIAREHVERAEWLMKKIN